MEPLIDRVARAIYEVSPWLHIRNDEPRVWDEAPTLIRAQAFKQARADVVDIRLLRIRRLLHGILPWDNSFAPKRRK